MSKYFGVFLFVPLMSLLFFFMYFVIFWQEEQVAYADFITQKQINYAADAAIEEMLFTGHLGTDYATTYKNVQPDLGMNEFCIVMLESLDMPTTDKDIKWYQDHYLKSLIVCAYDGLFVYDEKEYTTGEHRFVATPKIPYFYTDETGRQYTLNFGLKQGYSDSTEGGRYNVRPIENLPSHITEDQKYACINDMVSNYLAESIARAYGGHFNKNVQLPAFASEISGGQPIKNVSIIGIVETPETNKKRPNLCMAIGGARITEVDPIIGFNYNGINYYGPQSKIAACNIPVDSSFKPFNSEYDAAKEGYNCYLPAYE